MTQIHDLDEMVSLTAIVSPAKHPNHVPTLGKVGTLPLREALRVVIEDWDGDRQKQQMAMIVWQSGDAIEGPEKIRDLYNQLKTQSGM